MTSIPVHPGSPAVASPVAIIGGGNIGQAIAAGLVATGQYRPDQVIITRRHAPALESLAHRGFRVTTDNVLALRDAAAVVVAVRPKQLSELAAQLQPHLRSESVILSTVSGVNLAELARLFGGQARCVRVMPNTAAAIGESMTCLAARPEDRAALAVAEQVFSAVGSTLVIEEEQMTPATALCGCGVAFFLRSIRAASQGGIQIGFHSSEALLLAAQTAKGAATLLLRGGAHPEAEIDKVTTPAGCTISGLNQMEHEGFSSALIRGIVTSSEMAARLYDD